MSKNHQKSPPAPSFSGALSARFSKQRLNAPRKCAFPEHARPFTKANYFGNSVFRSIVGHSNVESPNFAFHKTGKEIWQEQSLT